MTKRKITKVLIANRGEISLRVQRACKKLSIPSLVIASEADRNSLFVREAEESVVIGPAAPKESYLNQELIINTAKANGCDAVHPGYGFLSENANFAEQVTNAGLVFIGPNPESIRVLGSKTAARAKVSEFGVPCTPGTKGDLSDIELGREAKRIGFPVIIKAVGGGGGRGMRIAQSDSELREALPRARAEALKNFSNEAVYLEKYIAKPRHVEVQVFGDEFGNVVHFGTRDCSTQRRHQKLVEEAPAPSLSEELRTKIQEAAVQAAKSVGYKNAGTAEFLVEGKNFYFLEMNTRIQVEHPVTELVTGVDLVELQLKVAMGEKLPFKQSDIKFLGHAIEFRIYAEEPGADFSPVRGRLTQIRRPEASWIREDYGYVSGDEASVYYDALLSKLIVFGPSREEAIARSQEALAKYDIQGVATTLDFHRWLIYDKNFVRAPVDIGYVERAFSAKCLEEVRMRQARDPKWQEPIAGAEFKELFSYKSEKFNASYTIELLHRRDGLFVASPVDAQGRKTVNSNKRLSNGKTKAIEALITGVLETTSPADIFSP